MSDNNKAPEATELCGVNILKASRYINLIVGTALAVVCGLNIFNIFTIGFDLAAILMNIFDW